MSCKSSRDSCCSPSEDQNKGCCSSSQDATAERVSRDMTIEEILSMFPHKAQRLSQEITNAGLHCVGCQAAVWETLEGGMKGHGMNDAQIEKLVDRLNALLDEESDLTTITLTKKAAEKYLSILEDEGKQGWGLRYAERAAGCSGFEYALDYSQHANPDDEVFVSQGIEIHVKKAMLDRLIGSEIDYVDGLQGAGFKISNPNVRNSCGCGTSHNY